MISEARYIRTKYSIIITVIALVVITIIWNIIAMITHETFGVTDVFMFVICACCCFITAYVLIRVEPDGDIKKAESDKHGNFKF